MKKYTYSGEEYDPDEFVSTSDNDSLNQKEETPRTKTRERKTKSENQKENSEEYLTVAERFANFFRRKTTRIIIGTVFIFVAVVLAVSFISYFSTGKADQTRVETESVSQMAKQPDTIQNAAGPAGAKMSQNFMVKGLGLGSMVVIYYLVVLGLSLYGFKKIKFWEFTFKSMVLAVTISYIAGLFTLNSSGIVPLGGYHGRYMNLYVISRLGWFGAFAVSLLLAVITVTLYTTQIVKAYNLYKTRRGIKEAQKIREEDNARNSQQRMAEALADGPISMDRKADKAEEKHREVEPSSVTIDNDIPFGKKKEEPVKKITDSPTSEMGPGFDVQHNEIEQAEGDLTNQHSIDGPYDPKAELSRYKMPSLNLLQDRPFKANSADLTEQEENKNRIIKTLNDYGIKIQHIKATVGPTVTLYEIIPAEGVRIAKIKKLEDDIALSLAALGIRIIAPIPGKGTIGIEVPNKEPQIVSIRSILGSKAYRESRYELPIALGAKIDNEVFIANLAKMPHLLVAGATGQGKSVGLNTIIASLLFKLHPSELKFVLIDPKQVEFSLYNRIENHYLAKLPDDERAVVTDPMKAINTLNSLCVEMDNRYNLLSKVEVRDIDEYNERFKRRRLNPENGHKYMPYIVIIVDEFADLIMTSGKAVETPIARIAQKARAVGMHMIIATQRPSTNVITGIIKANFPARIAFRVSQMVDSRTIIDAPGANQLIGRGDMLVLNGGTMERVQCALIDTNEVEALCQHVSDQIGYPEAYPLPEPLSDATEGGSAAGNFGGGPAERDPLFEEVARWIVQDNTASTSSLQRRYSIGFNRAGKIMDQLERAGIVGPAMGGKPRQVLVDPASLDIYLQN